MLLIVMLHHIPVTPNMANVTNPYAIGMRQALRTMLNNAGIDVRPSPLKAPAVTVSITMKTCEKCQDMQIHASGVVCFGFCYE